ncbi:MAG: response regulator transcription factor [Verrucomicrobiales bacterium]
MRILLVEDNAHLRDAVAERLRRDGFAVDATGDGNEGMWLALENPYTLLILDLTLPGLDGLDILRKIRAVKKEMAVLIATARDAVSDRVIGLDAGADDYIIKPFSLDELMARARAQMRRLHGQPDPVIRVADLEVDTKSRVARRGGAMLKLTAKEFGLLELLALRTGQVVRRADIWEQLYDFAEETDSNVIDVFINRLRKKSEASGGVRLIHTRRGLGYLLDDPEVLR